MAPPRPEQMITEGELDLMVGEPIELGAGEDKPAEAPE